MLRIACSTELDETPVDISADKLNVTTYFRERDYVLEKSGENLRFSVNKSPALALNRYYIERRMDAAEMF